MAPFSNNSSSFETWLHAVLEKIWCFFVFLRKRAIKTKFLVLLSQYWQMLCLSCWRCSSQVPLPATWEIKVQGDISQFFSSEQTVNHDKYRAKFGIVVSQAEVISLLQLKLGKKPVVGTHLYLQEMKQVQFNEIICSKLCSCYSLWFMPLCSWEHWQALNPHGGFWGRVHGVTRARQDWTWASHTWVICYLLCKLNSPCLSSIANLVTKDLNILVYYLAAWGGTSSKR